MPTLEVKPGVSFFYLDSGPPSPPNDTYLTLFVLHGLIFSSPIFSRAVAVSLKHNIRLVAITRRDYRGSSSLTSEEIRAVTHGSTEQRVQAFTDRAGEIMKFIEEFINKNSIPPISANSSGGGFSLCGWSLGNLQGLSVLAFGNRFPDLAKQLTPYFRSYIYYETAVLFPLPPNIYNPLLDESMPIEERGTCIISGDPALLNQYSPSTIKLSCYSQFTEEELAAIIDNEPLRRTDILFFELDQQVNVDILRYAFLQHDDSPRPAWPNVPVKSLWGDETPWSVIFSLRELERWLDRIKEDNNGRWIRAYDSNCVQGGNHFLHWDQPEIFMEKAKKLML
ncbi:hypothetical protein Clacol_000354 [Clathrus columnatus]|uniref:AB hydrolase-1 domain-containing protein n=1 Tax=Clathrus columnatus TaxID=1419009 RepID=A0AAV4ZX07_9AGAM|nr:hypothetical protein Clacol_000354 [Clathrus columnatus]